MSVLLQADRVRVEFGDLVAVRDVSFKLDEGQLLGLIGPNGAGKTTLLRVLAGLHAPTAGQARIMGVDVREESHRIRGEVGFAPDAPPAYDDITIDEFLVFIARSYGLPWKQASERIDFWLEQLWLTEKRAERIGTLSRGMKQRVTVARTLIPNPAVVLLDEPSQGLDPKGRVQLRQVVAGLRNQGKAVIVSSHILADLEEYCTDIGIIEHGAMLRFGAVRSLTGRAVGRHRYRLALTDSEMDIADTLAGIDEVAEVVRLNGAFVFEYIDDRSAAGALLRELMVDRNLPIAEFAPLPDTLEESYLRAGVQQVD